MEIRLTTREEVKALLRTRAPSMNKGDFGHSLLVAGSMGRMGAAVIAARACLRAGTGLLTLIVPKAERTILQAAVPEAMLRFGNTKAQFADVSAIGIGPDMGLGKGTKNLLVNILEGFSGAILLDADALNILAANTQLFKKVGNDTVITPHPIEFDRLFGRNKNEAERRKAAIRLAVEHQWVIVLKGHQTLVAGRDGAFLNSTGNAGLAKGGSGDALSGIITALLAQGYAPFIAARLGVYLHGLSADIALGGQSMESMLINDAIDCLGKAFRDVLS